MAGARPWLGCQIAIAMHPTAAKGRVVRHFAIPRPSPGIVASAVSAASLAVAIIATIVH
jgi:hypothetical protein